MKSAFTFLALCFFQMYADASTLRQKAKFDLPGQTGKRFDYLAIDYKHNYLLSAHLGAGLLYVIDIATNRLISTIPGVPGVEGVEIIPELDKVYTSNWGNHTIGVIDLSRMQVIKKLPAEVKPDGSVYAPPFGKLYVSDERAKSVIVVDVHKDEVVKVIRFQSETGMPQFDSVTRKVYVNLQDSDLMAIIDPLTDNVVQQVPVSPCHGNHGMALDTTRRRAFLACEGNNHIAMLDLNTMKIMSGVPVPSGVDVIRFDPGLLRLYAACYSGAISVLQETATGLTKLEDFAVQPKVHSLAVDLRTHRVYAPEEEENGRPVSRMVVFEAI